MIKHMTIKLAALGSGALLFGSSLAQANSSTPMTVIDSTAGQLCRAIDRDPSPGGVVDALSGTEAPGLDEVDLSMVIASAIHHVCPQYGDLLTNVSVSVASDELCGRPV